MGVQNKILWEINDDGTMAVPTSEDDREIMAMMLVAALAQRAVGGNVFDDGEGKKLLNAVIEANTQSSSQEELTPAATAFQYAGKCLGAQVPDSQVSSFVLNGAPPFWAFALMGHPARRRLSVGWGGAMKTNEKEMNSLLKSPENKWKSI